MQVEPEKLERTIAGQIACACRVSPTEGRKRVRVARDLHDGLDHLRRLFGAGELSAYKVSTVVTATAHLDAAERAEVDRLLAAHATSSTSASARCATWPDSSPRRSRRRSSAPAAPQHAPGGG